MVMRLIAAVFAAKVSNLSGRSGGDILTRISTELCTDFHKIMCCGMVKQVTISLSAIGGVF